MRALLAPNAFKGTVTAAQAAEAMARGVHRARPGWRTVEVPVADGGEGTAEALASATDGKLIGLDSIDALGRPCRAYLARLGDGVTFGVDAASASGLALLGPNELDPLGASSYGTGLLLLRAIELGARRIILGVGNTAFVDGGAGMATALGVRFLRGDGEPVHPGGGGLRYLERVDVSCLDPRCFDVRWQVAVDVQNPLLGPNGAAQVYAPQKGASQTDVGKLEEGLARMADELESVCKEGLREIPGMGAGGGMALPLVGLLGADLVAGGEVVADAVGLDEHMRGCGLVITGEGMLDGQTMMGKAPAVVAKRAAACSIPAYAVVGRVGRGVEKLREIGLLGWEETSPHRIPTPREAARLLEEGTARLISRVLF